MRRIRELAGALLALGCAGCAPAVGWLPDPSELQRWPFGGAATVHTFDRRTYGGELIAVARDSLHLLTWEGLVAVPKRDVSRVEVQADRKGQVRTSVFFARTRARVDWKRERGWQTLQPFARFPGGLPDSLDRTTLVNPTSRTPSPPPPPPGRMERPRR